MEHSNHRKVTGILSEKLLLLFSAWGGHQYMFTVFRNGTNTLASPTEVDSLEKTLEVVLFDIVRDVKLMLEARVISWRGKF